MFLMYLLIASAYLNSNIKLTDHLDSTPQIIHSEAKIDEKNTIRINLSKADDKDEDKDSKSDIPPAENIYVVTGKARGFFYARRRLVPKYLLNSYKIYVDLRTRYLYLFDKEFRPILSEIPVGIGSGGIGNEPNSYKTPSGIFWGEFEVSKCKGCTLRIIKGVPMITSAAIWMHGLESRNSNSFKRGIGIHAYPGKWLATGRGNDSWGCIVTTDEDMWKIVETLKAKTKDKIIIMVNEN